MVQHFELDIQQILDLIAQVLENASNFQPRQNTLNVLSKRPEVGREAKWHDKNTKANTPVANEYRTCGDPTLQAITDLDTMEGGISGGIDQNYGTMLYSILCGCAESLEKWQRCGQSKYYQSKPKAKAQRDRYVRLAVIAALVAILLANGDENDHISSSASSLLGCAEACDEITILSSGQEG